MTKADDYWNERKYTAARRAWALDRTGKMPESHPTWAAWWESMYGEGQTMTEYIREKQREKSDLHE